MPPKDENKELLRQILTSQNTMSQEVGVMRATHERDLKHLKENVDLIRSEAQSHGAQLQRLTTECTKRGVACEQRFRNKSEELDRIRANSRARMDSLEDQVEGVQEDLQLKVNGIREQTGRFKIIEAKREEKEKLQKEQRSSRVKWAVLIIGWILAGVFVTMKIVLS